MHRAVSLSLGLLMMFVTLDGRGDGVGVPVRGSSLHYVRLPGAEACIDVVSLAASVEARLRRPVFVAPTRASVLVDAWAEALAAPGLLTESGKETPVQKNVDRRAPTY